ncbi:ICMT-domain-containing protein [Punctularia strigosozonata HHB-11173 SS5]|uniref:ICMT-domain-containing protein n=1 Tax=Punctularia strigosozonata (strain HHB-11173) TaxID=741275 RepID=UPI0004417B62|nr:ICMT-domain-containing protein [Punctularia strigosozonata HHB-11173 SS5]EIN10426.1 ICMT-domain-containing protein [Punctularia strigosozonata HHB-11173 SS5]
MASDADASNGFDERLKQRSARKPDALDLTATGAVYAPTGTIPNTLLAVVSIAFALGGVFSIGAIMFLSGGFDDFWWSTYQLGFFVAAWSAFHWGEFAVTAGWNADKCSVDSFLLNNGMTYHAANGTALLEYLITLYFKPESKRYHYVSALGIIMTICGQILRSTAMIHAARNFSHTVASRKAKDHVLVTDGIYAYFRHPSYAGFFYWALGTQLVLQNPVTFVMFSYLLWRFFYYRTRYEEGALVRFFGAAYEEYRKKVGTKIPFVP